MKKEEVVIELSKKLQDRLIAEGTDSATVTALIVAVSNVNSTMRSACVEYASGLDAYHQQYGTVGLKRRVGFMLGYMKTWNGAQASACRKLLNAWITAK